MSKIKRFDEILNENSSQPMFSPELLEHLKDGYAIHVKKEDVDKFYDTLGYYIWIDFIRQSKDVLPPELYFVLIGNKIYHTEKPNLGGQEFEVYEPTWDDLKPYKEIE